MSSRINCLIIDDEPLARSLIKAYLIKRADFNILGECLTASEAYELLVKYDVHVIFLDIQMTEISGIDFLKTLKHPPKIIFTTAYSNFAVEAFNLNAVDYLIKPITEDRFEQALDKLKSSLGNNSIVSKNTAVNTIIIDYIFFRIDGKLVKVQFDDILYLEALKDFTKVYLKNDKTILVGDHLKAVESHMPNELFMRIHRSFLVSLKAITGLFGNTLEIGNKQLPVGGNYKDQLFAVLNIK